MKAFPFTVLGIVVRGAGRGRSLGFATANLALRPEEIPEKGVYKVEAGLDEKTFAALCNVGLRPTVDGRTGLHVEVHIPGFSGDLYGRTLRLTFLSKLREERKFPDVEALKAQIRADIDSLSKLRGIARGLKPGTLREKRDR